MVMENPLIQLSRKQGTSTCMSAEVSIVKTSDNQLMFRKLVSHCGGHIDNNDSLSIEKLKDHFIETTNGFIAVLFKDFVPKAKKKLKRVATK